MDVFSNIAYGLKLKKVPKKEIAARVEEMLDLVQLSGYGKRMPSELSGGQKQRAAVARALITKPQLILADEPTGALDSRAADGLLRMFTAINGEGQTILMVTHSIQAASHAGRVLFIKDGSVFHQIYKGERSYDAMYRMISDTLTVLQTEPVRQKEAIG